MSHKKINPQHDIDELLNILAKLRNTDSGCEWNLAQDFNSIAAYTIEEAYEVAEAIENKDMPALCDELGDLLYQVVYHSRLAQEADAFNFSDVVAAACDKAIRRHPQVFAKAKIETVDDWALQKQKENKADTKRSILGAVESNQPAMNRAYQLQKKASSVGFDWDDLSAVVAKLDEEILELKDEIKPNNQQRIGEELGDVLFSCINLARHLEINPESSLRQTNKRFYERFNYIEQHLKGQGLRVETCSLAELDELWNRAKKALSLSDDQNKVT